MWDVTCWALAMWLRLLLALAVILGVAWLIFGTGSGWFWTLAVLAVLVVGFLTRQLGRAWRFEASLRWWWSR